MDCVLITQPIRAFYGIVHVPSPVIFVHTVVYSPQLLLEATYNRYNVLSQRSIDASLCGYRVTSCREQLRYTRGFEPRLRKPESCTETSSTSTDDEGIVFVVLAVLSAFFIILKRSGVEHTITGYFCAMKGDASFARNGWWAKIRPVQCLIS